MSASHAGTYSDRAENFAPQHTPFPAGSSQLAGLIREFDWSKTELGPIEQWDATLCATVNLMLQSPIPIVLLWGPNGVLIYNDGYAVIAGNRHPVILGVRALEAWPEVADFNRHVIEVGLAGGRLSYHDQHLVLYRNGVAEDVWLDLNYSPVFDEHGKALGVMAIVIETTGRVAEEQKRRAAEERFQLTLDAGAIVGTWLWEIEANRLTTDERFARLFSLDPSDATRGVPIDTLSQAVHPDDLEPLRAQFLQAAAMGGRFRTEFRVRRDNGSYRWIESNGHFELAPDGSPQRFPGVLIDIEERKRSEAQQAFLLALSDRLRELGGADDILRTATEMIGRFFNAGRAGYGEVTPTGTEFIVDHEWTNGRTKEFAGHHTLDDFGPLIIGEFRAGRGVRLNNIEYDIRTQDENITIAFEEIDMRSGMSVPLIKDGRWVASFYVHKATPHIWTEDDEQLLREVAERTWNAVERVRAEERLRTLNATLEQQVAERTRERDRIWNVSQDLLGIADANGVWLSVNPAWSRALGWHESDILGHTSEWMEHPEDRERTRAEVRRISTRNPTMRFENRFRHQNGSYRWLAWTAVFSDEQIYAVARDITAEREQQVELDAIQEQLRHAQKMEAVGQLTGGIAHDFNNLLTGIIGGLDMLGRRIAAGRYDEVERYLTTATASAKRAASLTHRLLAFSRRQSLDIHPTDINTLISSLEDLLRRTMGESITFITNLQPELWPAQTDASQFESALLNLCINARDAMPNGGELIVATTQQSVDPLANRELGELQPGDYVVMSVSDTGTGMPPNVLERAFDPFFTTKPIGQGTGLGLSMIYGFMKQSGGHVHMESQVGHGTTVKLFLPRHTEQIAPQEQEDAPVTHTADGESILVVEDDESVRMLLTEVLYDLGYRVIEAGDAKRAIACLEDEARIDLMITDVGLPGMNGRQLAEIARQRRPELPILFVTGYAESAASRSGFLDAGMDMINKPFDIDALANKVRTMIAQGA